MNYNNFDWGTSSDWYKKTIINEIFENKIYEKFFNVSEGDIVFDIGASKGPFTYSILDKNPKHIFCFEPSFTQFITLVKNTSKGPVTCINKAISEKEGSFHDVGSWGDTDEISYTIKFSRILSDYNISIIDFLKTDCEGGEYDIFNDQNLDWITKNVKKISGEWHLENDQQKKNFRKFRDTYLNNFNNFYVYSVDLVDIKWSLWTDEFIEYYNQVLIYIDNR